ncbi:MAG: nucleotidyltransferase domain-containing protein [Nitrospirae bacterium]|nr:MAG: nucleotidyltransferase domain-containing protein [Nitrospirota bacterium]
MARVAFELSNRQRRALVRIAKGAGARLLVLFGSVARGDTHPHSDLDLAVDLGRPGDLETHLELIRQPGFLTTDRRESVQMAGDAGRPARPRPQA